MKLESNIFFSAAAHLLLIAATLFLAGRNAVSHFPGRYIEVTLMNQDVPAVSVPTMGKRASAGTAPATVRGPAAGARKPAPHKAVKAISPEHKRSVAGSADISAPASSKQAEVPKATTPEAGRALTEGKKELLPAAKGRNFLSESTKFTIDISHYSAEERAAGIVGTGGPFYSPERGVPPSSGGDNGGGIDGGVTNAGEKGVSQAIGEIRALIEKARRYPLMARNRGIEGTVTAEFSINTAGLPENVRITSSSGFAILDSAAKETIFKAAPFPVVKGKIEVPISYRLRREE